MHFYGSKEIINKTTKMKKIIAIAALLFCLFTVTTATAQVNVKINIGNQPAWGPTGYDYVDYYYLPDIDMYYYVPTGQYIYLQGNRWVYTSNLPNRYRNFDFNSGYKVVINERRPYEHAAMYRAKYASYRGNRNQQIIRNSREEKYYKSKGHPKHNEWKNSRNGDKRNDDKRNDRGGDKKNDKKDKRGGGRD
jgi:hypothetical protein